MLRLILHYSWWQASLVEEERKREGERGRCSRCASCPNKNERRDWITFIFMLHMCQTERQDNLFTHLYCAELHLLLTEYLSITSCIMDSWALLTLFCFVLLCQRKLMNQSLKWMTVMETMELLSYAGMTAMWAQQSIKTTVLIFQTAALRTISAFLYFTD